MYRRLTAKLPLGALLLGIFSVAVTIYLNLTGSPHGHSHIHQEDIDKQKPDIEDESGTSVYSSTAWWLWFAIVSSDWLIAVAYLCIPLELLYFWCSFGGIASLNSILFLFVAFISLCGTTHIASAVYDDSRYATAVHAASEPMPATFLLVSKVTTSLVSIFTAIYTVRILPMFLSMPARLEQLQVSLTEKVEQFYHQEAEKEEERKSRERLEALQKNFDLNFILTTTVNLIGADFRFDRTTIFKIVSMDPSLIRLSVEAEHVRDHCMLPLARSVQVMSASRTPLAMSTSQLSRLTLGSSVVLGISAQVQEMLPFAQDVSQAIVFPLACHFEDLTPQSTEDVNVGGFSAPKSATPNLLLCVQRSSFSSLPLTMPDLSLARLSAFVPHVQNALLHAQFVHITTRAVSVLQERAIQLEKASHDAEEANKAKSAFLATISHEIRTPMQAISALSELLLEQDDQPLPPSTQSQLETIRSGAAILSIIMSDILDFTSSDRWNPEYKVCSIRNLVEESIGIVFVQAKNNKGNIEFAYVLDSSCPKEATTDAARVMQVLVNLISNSIKNTEQGSIVVRVTRSGPEMLQFEVRDTGIGVLPEHHPSLFKKFCRIPNKFNEHLGGVGLGLAICKKVTHKLGGHIWLESTGVPGEGTKVTFTIADSEPRSVSPPQHRIGTSLLIATSAPLREQLTEQFNFLGLTVAHTNTIEEALDEGRRPSKPFCAILIDPDRAGLNWNDPKTQTQLDELGFLGPVAIMVSQTLSPMEADLVETPVVLKPIRLSVLRSIANKCKPELDDDSEAIPTTIKNMHPLAKSSSSAYPTESRQLDSRGRRSSSLGDGNSVLNFDGLRVLIVEDNLVVQRVFKTLFTKVGAAKISIANTGVQALEVLKADPSSADVIMMDINMPEMDGVTCTGRIISEYGKGAYWIIGVSAASLEETQTYLKAGMDDFLSKPVKMDAIQGALARFHASRAKRAASMDSARQYLVCTKTLD